MVTVLNLTYHKQPIMDFQKKRSTFAQKEQDPMSHRIIEKRRRDRMNNCLADLSRLIPTDYLKKGRGRIEKTEIIEMAIKHLKYLQDKVNSVENRDIGLIPAEPFRLGYQECVSEVMRYLVKTEGHYPRDPVNLQLIKHLHRHCDNVFKGDIIKLRSNPDSNSSSSSTSSNYITHNQTSVQKNIQRIMSRAVNSDKLHQHANNFEHQRDDKPDDIEYIRNTQDYAEELIENLPNEQRDISDNQNMNPIVHGNFPGLKKTESNVDEGGGLNLRTDFIPKVSPINVENDNNDCQSVQDLRLVNSYMPMSSAYHYAYCEQTRRHVRKGDNHQGDSGLSLTSSQADPDFIHSYKFKNTIKQRFSQSQSTDGFSSSPSDMAQSYKSAEHSYIRQEKLLHKKRKTSDHQMRNLNSRYNNNQYKDQNLSSESNSSDNITSVSQNSTYRSNNMQVANLGNGRPSDNNYQLGHIMRHGKMNPNFTKLTRIGVPIFALHAKGSFYVPLNVDYECLVPFLGPYDLLDTASLQSNTSLHPITISVNF